MKLVSFTVTKYRSIKNAHQIHVGNMTVLVGPNNEGKSNLLRALVTAMRVLMRARVYYVGQVRLRNYRFRSDADFDWKRDFPIDLQESQHTGHSDITLEFELTEDEIEEFRHDVHSRLNGTLPIRISLGPEAETDIKVIKKGPGGRSLTEKSKIIAKFVSTHISFEHIPAVRTANIAKEIVGTMVERELETLETEDDYIAALDSIARLQQPTLDRISLNIKDTLKKFLPAITSVRVQIPPEARYKALRRICQIWVDDGTSTLLENKGDGMQSLAALGLMRHAFESAATSTHLLVAIEEPESHLHPGAIHELRQAMRDLSQRYQVIITTHNPLFIDRSSLRNNIIVQSNRARPAKNIKELRSALGIHASDNLLQAELVLLVEGEDDQTVLTSLLSSYSSRCHQAIETGQLTLIPIDGAGNLSFYAQIMRNSICSVHCFLDDDTAARLAFEKARTRGLLVDRDANWSICNGKRISEIEDLYDPTCYAEMVQNEYHVNLNHSKFRTSDKWTKRMSQTFRAQGQHWDDRIEKDVKNRVARLVATAPETSVLSAHRSVIEGLTQSLESRINHS